MPLKTLLSDKDLREICNDLKIPLRYVGYKDSFLPIKPLDGAYIINLDSKVENRGGTHWVALILKHKQAIYFDSFGLTIPIETRTFISRYRPKRVLFSTRQIQHIDSTMCGYFCIYFLYFFKVLHKTNPHFGYLINKHDSIYVQMNRKLNDKIIAKLMDQLMVAQKYLKSPHPTIL